MQFYKVSDRYINFLKKLDTKIPDNYSGKRPYVGIVLEINGHKYLAPLTSHKPKQDKLQSTNPTIYKIHEKGNENNKLGMLHFNNMIPVIDSEIATIDFSTQDKKYSSLLSTQLAFIKSNQDNIKTRAKQLYNLVTVNKNAHFCSLSCDFIFLEDNYRKFTA